MTSRSLRLASFAALAASLVLVLASVRPAGAINANPAPVDLRQPDGTVVRLHVIGDEWAHWWQDMNGYAVVLDQGGYVYARLGADGGLESTGQRVGAVDPAALGLTARLHPTDAYVRAANPARLRPTVRPTDGTIPARGTIKNLVILARFSDHTLGVQTRAKSAYDSLYNLVGSRGFNTPTGSVRDAWHEYSLNGLDLQSTVIDWVTLPQAEAYYANADSGRGNKCPTCVDQMVIDALNAANAAGVDFGQFDVNNDGYVDAIDIIHSGYGSEADGNPNHIWSQKKNLPVAWDSGDNNGVGQHVKVLLYHTEPALWSTSGRQLVRIGVIAHETGHFFGLPDLYDRDNSSSGIGSYCLMSNSWGFANDQLYPPHPSAWCKVQLGWVTPATYFLPGNATLHEVEDNPEIVRIEERYQNTNEYLLVENRQPIGLDAGIPQGGLAVWHIDETVPDNNTEGYPGQSGWPGNGKHYKVALLQADGKYELEQNIDPTPGLRGGDAGDLFHDVPGIALSERTTPATDAYMGGYVMPTGNEISAISASGPTMTFHYRPATFVKFGWAGVQTGRFDEPYTSLGAGLSAAPNDGIVICESGVTGEKPTISTSRFLKTYGGTTLIGIGP